MTLPDLYLVRHGRTVWNDEGRLQGRLDSPLTPLGRSQMVGLRPVVAGIAASCLSSPRGRAVESARLLVGEAFTCDPRLAEIDIGDFTGHRLDDLRQTHPEVFTGAPHDIYDRIPQGEGTAALQARLRDLLSDLQGPTLLVTHGMVLSVICSLVSNRPIPQVHASCQIQGVMHILSESHHRIVRGKVGTGQAGAVALKARSAGG